MNVGGLPLKHHWTSIPARRVLVERQDSVRDVDEIVTCFRDGQVTLRRNRREEGFTNAIQEHGYKAVERGDLVVHSMDAFAGAVGVSDSRGKMSPVVGIYRAPVGDPRFYAYYLRACAYSGYIESLAKGIRERSTSFDRQSLANLHVPDVPVEEQRRIADFLDDQVARIDETLAHKSYEGDVLRELYRSQLLEVLGTEPTPTFLEGLESESVGLGQLCSRMVAGGTPTSSDPELWADDGVPWISIGDMVDGSTTQMTGKHVSSRGLEQSRLVVQPAGVLLFAMYASVGKVSVSGMPAVWNQAILGLTLRQDVPQGFILAWLELARPSLPAIARSATQDNLNADQVRRMRVPRRSEAEMIDVARERFRARESMSARLNFLEVAAVLLEERKRAVITAAVTGDLDVSTARPIGIGKWRPKVGTSIDNVAPENTPAQAPSIGGTK